MKIVVTQGDPRGIGPEVLLKTLAAFEPPVAVEVEVLADPAVLEAEARKLYLPVPPAVIPVNSDLEALEESARLALSGEVAAIVTAPVHKARLRARGFPFPGQTEFFAERLGAAEHAMMLAGGGVRAVPFTTHCALAEVPGRLERSAIVRRVRKVHEALRMDFGIPEPRIAVLGLNPHAGEEGLFGREEIEIIAPAVADLRSAGITAEGPLPADAAFLPRTRSRFDAHVGMYHDQVLAPFKALAGGEGVNLTLGLPVVRTSPDHGTADDIAGRGIADPSSFRAALAIAIENAGRRAEGILAGGASPP